MSVFFTADLHFCHYNIINHTKRPFTTADEMNKALITNWNKVVGNGDIVYFLGDIGMGKRHDLIECVRQLNGQIHWIKGNHDKKQVRWKDLTCMFAWVGDYKEIRVEGQKIAMFHYPIASWNGIHKGGWHVHGHTHGTFYDSRNKQVDVGTDCWNYTPVSFEQLKEYMDTKEFVPIDGHGKTGVYKNSTPTTEGEV